MSKFTGNIIRLPAVTPTQNSASGVYTLDDQFTAQSSGTWPIVRDQYFNYTTLLLTGAVQGTAYPNPVTQPYSFLSDASTNNFVVSPNGDVSARPFNPYLNNYSNYFNGSSGVNFANNAGFDFSTGDFTIESWVYIAGNSALDGSSRRYANIFSVSTTGAFNVNFVVRGDSTTTGTGLEIYNGTSTVAVTGSISQNAWNHVAVSRSGANAYFWLNGQQMGATQSISGSWGSSANAGQVGQSANTVGYSFPLIGYLSNVRVVKGRAVYTSAFTPSTTPLTRTSGGTNPPQGTECVLLTCQSNRFLDSNGPNVPASSPLTTTVSGSPAVSQNSPFVSYDTTNGSGYFDGTGDYLNTASQSAFNVSNGAFTVEFWVYPTNLSVNQGFISSTFSSNFHVAYLTTGSLLYFWIANSQVNADVSSQLKANQWNHIAVARGAANAVAGWVNGVKLLTGNLSGTGSAQPIYIGTSSHSLTETTFGYISNARMVNGTDVYGVSNSTIPVPTAPLQAITNTSLLTLQTRAPATNNGFIDSSPNNFVVTRNGNTTQGSFSPFSPTGWSVYGSGSSYLIGPTSNEAMNLGTGAYTLEGWIYLTSYAGAVYQSVIFCAGNANGAIAIGILPSGALDLSKYGTGSVVTSSANDVLLNTWYHVAAVRTSTATNDTRLYVNGVLKATGTDNNNWNVYTTPTVGALAIANFNVSGYLSNVRVVKGVAVYTGAFTPPASPLSSAQSAGPTGSNIAAITGSQTSLLTCQSNRFRDASSYNFTITTSGSPSVQAFSPFAPAQSYIPSQIGGSGYFDGTNDYLNIPNAAFNNITTGTIECWVYLTDISGACITAKQQDGVTTQGLFSIGKYANTAGALTTGTPGVLYWHSTNTSPATANSTAGIVANTWNHIAIVFNSSSVTFYINGVASGATNGNYSLPSNTAPVPTIGQWVASGTQQIGTTGWISSLRITADSVYSGNFTPPTAPLTAIPNTSLLLNFTNGGIVDATGKNNWETLGKAQIATTESKWAPGSIYLDGTSGTYVKAPVQIYLGSANFTIEGWVRFPVSPGALGFDIYKLQDKNDGSSLGALRLLLNSSMKLHLLLSTAGSAWNVSADNLGNTLSTGIWYYIAVTRSGNDFKVYVNGSQAGATQTLSGALYAGPINALGWNGITTYSNVYLDDVRLTVGIARDVTASPTGPFPLG